MTNRETRRTQAATIYRAVGEAINLGLPVPYSVTTTEKPMLYIDADDLIAWVAHFDLPGPDWQPTPTGAQAFIAATIAGVACTLFSHKTTARVSA